MKLSIELDEDELNDWGDTIATLIQDTVLLELKKEVQRRWKNRKDLHELIDWHMNEILKNMEDASP